MLSSINFEYLITLGITSWLILLYLHFIENSQNRHPVPEVMVEEPIEPKEAPPQKADFCSPNIDLYLNFVCLFFCAFALARYCRVAEVYLKELIQANSDTRGSSHNKDNDGLPPHSEEQYRSILNSLMLRINSLETADSFFHMRLKQLQHNTLSLFMNKMTACGCGATGLTNGRESPHVVHICGGNLHGWSDQDDGVHQFAGIEIARDDYVGGDGWTTTNSSSGSQQKVNVPDEPLDIPRGASGVDGANQANSSASNQSATEEPVRFHQFWHKYLEMQRATMRQVITSVNMPTPLVVSTEDMEVMHGIFTTSGAN